MSNQNNIKQQRDRFLAFSFASADLFLEVGEGGEIAFVFGAAKGLTGLDDAGLMGKFWLDIFSHAEGKNLKTMRENAKTGMRCGPLVVPMSDQYGAGKRAIVTAIKMPGSEHFYLTLATATELGTQAIPHSADAAIYEVERTQAIKEEIAGFNRTTATKDEIAQFERTQAKPDEIAAFERTSAAKETFHEFDRTTATKEEIAEFERTQAKKENIPEFERTREREERIPEFERTHTIKEPVLPFQREIGVPTAVMDKDNFTLAATDAIEQAKESGTDIDITLLDLTPEKNAAYRIGDKYWVALIAAVEATLLDAAEDGSIAGEIAEGRYGLVHAPSFDSRNMGGQITALAATKEPGTTDKNIEIKRKKLSGGLAGLSAKEATRALIYSLAEFERKGTDINVDTFGEGLKTFATDSTEKLKTFQSIIERLNFQLHFQPIVNLSTMQATHYEMLSRFEKGETQEWIMFGEDVGLASDFDLAVCERAISFIRFKAGGTRTKFSINISGQSVGNEHFREKLVDLLRKDKSLPQRLIFEITESSHIIDLDKVNEFIHLLQERGFQVALDDFGAGAASLEYLQKLHIDYVKIDGNYIRKIQHSQRDQAMVRNIVKMCKDLNTLVIAEFVETEEQFHILKEMGVDYGQGYLFGRPEHQPSYQPKSR